MARARRVIACVAVAVAALVGTGCTLSRPEDPVVLTGADVSTLEGTAPGKILAWRWLNGWQQVPVQVDERASVDLGKVYNSTPTGVRVLTYTDPDTFTGADPDPALDANDEVAFMGQDVGPKASGSSPPPGTVAGSGVEVKVTNPLNDAEGYLYLFKQTGERDPGAGKRYVDYRFKLLSGPYKTTYRLSDGPNPEDSTVTTGSYAHHFSDRWIDDALKITAGRATGVDILDRHKNLFAPGNCVRSEDTFSDAEGAFVVNKNGPVRAIRTYLGANSGPLTERQHVFYERRQDITTFLRVHQIPSVMDFFDYSPAASGMTYKSEAAPGGVTIDGTPDAPAAGQIRWESVDGPQGGLSIAYETSTDIPGFAYTSYYLDQKSPTGSSERQCTGDGAAYGSSGPWITQSIPNTDPTLGAANRLEFTRHLYYEAPGKANGAARLAQVRSPLLTSVQAWP